MARRKSRGLCMGFIFSACQSRDNLAQKLVAYKGHLAEDDFRRTFKLRRKVSFAKKALRPLFTESDLRGSFSVHAQNEPVSEIGPQLQGHHICVGSLCREDQRNPGSAS